MKNLFLCACFILSITVFGQVIPNKDLVVQALSPTGADVTGLSTAIDYTTGAVYTCGYINTVSNGKDLIVVKLDSNLVQQWVATYDFASLDDKANAICIDGSGNVYVTGGSAQGSGNADIVTIKYNSSGTQQWVSRVNGTNNTNDQGNSILYDGSNVWVTGYVTITGKGKDAVILKLNGSTGATIASPRRSGTANADDTGERICTDGTSVFITGTTKNTSTNGDVFVACINISAATLTWSISVDGTLSGDDSGLDCKIDNSELFICGYLNNTTTGNDYYFARINKSSGSILYSNTYDGGYNGSDMATSFVPDKLGGYAVTGIVTNGSDNEYHTQMYSTSALIWTHIQPLNSSYTTSYPKIARDTIAGHFYVCGTNYHGGTLDGILYQLAPSGNKMWTQYHNGTNGARDIFTDLVVDGLGRIFVCSPNETSTTNVYDYMVIRYSQTPVYFPVNYNMLADTFSIDHLYYPNSGEVVDTNRTSVQEVLFYTKFTNAKQFVMKNKVAYCEYRIDSAKVNPKDTMSRVDMIFDGANEFSETFGEYFQEEAKLNYFLDYTGSSGITNVAGASQLIVPNIYPMIDLHYSSNTKGAKYYFVVKPTGDPSDITIRFDGAISTATVSNKLVITSELGSWEFKKPDIYNVSVNLMTMALTTTTVSGTSGWMDMGSDTYKFNPGTYNSAWPLVIEFDMGKSTAGPDITDILWSTYLGDAGYDHIAGIKNDAANNLFVVGLTTSANFPQAVGATVYDPSSNGGFEGFVSKFEPNGKHKWSTYVGGTGNDSFNDLSIAPSGDIFCVGVTTSSDLVLQTPVGAFTDTYQSGNDGFIFQLEQDGQTNPWLTYYGGNQDDYLSACGVDLDGNFFLVGYSNSTDYYVGSDFTSYTHNISHPGAPGGTYYYDGIIARFDNSDDLTWATYIGGTTSPTQPNDLLWDLTFVDPGISSKISTADQDFYVSGTSRSNDYPNVNYGSSTNHSLAGISDVVITRFTNVGAIVYSSYFGGSNGGEGAGSIKNRNKKTYVTGNTNSTNWSQTNSGLYYYQGSKVSGGFSGTDAFFMVIDENDAVIHSTYLGGNNDDCGSEIDVANNDVVYIVGYTESTNLPFPTSNPANTYVQGSAVGYVDNFICALECTNTKPSWTTYLGGSDEDGELYNVVPNACISFDNNNHFYLGGYSFSQNTQSFPLDDGGGSPCYFQPTKAGGWDGTITKFDILASQVIGIEEKVSDNFTIFMYPNPTTGNLNIRLKEGMKNLDYRIYDALGKNVSSGKLINEISAIDTKIFNAGVYFIEIYNNDKRQTAKFVKND